MSIAFRVVIQDQPMGYHPVLAHICGGLAEGVLLGRLLYWDGVMAKKHGEKYSGEFYKSDRELCEETGLSECELRTAKKVVLELGFMELNVRGIPPTTHYRVCLERLQDAIEKGDCVRPDKRPRNEHGKFTHTANQSAIDDKSISPQMENQLPKDRANIQYSIQDATQNETQNGGETKPVSPAPEKKERKHKEPKKEIPPAVGVFRECRCAFPPKEHWQEIDEAVGTEPRALEFWRDVLMEYSKVGFNRQSVGGPLDFFRRGQLPKPRSGNGQHVPDLVPIPSAAFARRSDFTDEEWRRILPANRRKIISFETGVDLNEVEDDLDYRGSG